MITTPAELESIEKFFAATTLPKVFKLNAGITIHDLPGYVSKILAGIRAEVFSDAVARPRWDDLVEIRKKLEMYIQQNINL